MISRIGQLIAAASLVTLSTLTHAAWPEKPITLVVPYPPGGNADVLGRMFAQHLTSKLGQMVIVENKPGGSSQIGSLQVVRSAPDGYTILLGSIANVLNQFFYKKTQYDMNKDLIPVSQLVSVPNYVAVGPTEKFRSMSEIVAYAKANPKKVSCANTGIGASTYLSCELIKSMAGIDLLSVPYKGGVPAMQDVMGGQATMVVANEALAWINDKRLIGIAVTSAQRSPLAPDLPAVSESIPGFDVSSWYGVFVPVGVPQDIVERIAREATAMMKDEAVINRLKLVGASPVGTSPAEFQAFFEAEMHKWEKVTKTLNVQLD